MNIIFEGDWVKIQGKWRQVVEIENNCVRIFSTSYGMPLLLDGDDPRIEKVLSDPEMQKILEVA